MKQAKQPKPLTKLQLAWAKQHSWFRKVLDTSEGKVIIASCEVITATGKVEGSVLVTGNFNELRNWAGY